MAVAISRNLREAWSDVQIVVPKKHWSSGDRARYDMGLSADVTLGRLQKINAMIPDFAFRLIGATPRRAVDVLIDASGFAFSDQWGPAPATRLLRKMNHPGRQHQKLVLMPQAFGPFEGSELRESAKRLFSRASLVFARDRISYDHCVSLNADCSLHLCPDITITEKPQPDTKTELPEKFFSIVPNVQMKRKTSDASGEAYLASIGPLAGMLSKKGLAPVIILHDRTTDIEFVPDLKKILGDIPVVSSDCPMELKAIIGRSEVVVASRFHALVAAYSQCIPSIAIGWSHKYQCLLEDFGCPALLLKIPLETERAQSVVDSVTDTDKRAAICATIAEHLAKQTQQVESMWKQVHDCIQS